MLAAAAAAVEQVAPYATTARSLTFHGDPIRGRLPLTGRPAFAVRRPVRACCVCVCVRERRTRRTAPLSSRDGQLERRDWWRRQPLTLAHQVASFLQAPAGRRPPFL